MIDLYNAVGYIGVASYVGSYFLLKIGKIKDGYLYTFMNLIGALCVSFSLLEYFNLPSLIIQGVWLVISLLGIFIIYKNKSEFDEVHLAFDAEDNSIPSFFLLTKRNKIIEAFDYNKGEFWRKFNKEEYSVQTNKFFTKTVKISSYTNPPPLRHKSSHSGKALEVINNRGEIVDIVKINGGI